MGYKASVGTGTTVMIAPGKARVKLAAEKGSCIMSSTERTETTSPTYLRVSREARNETNTKTVGRKSKENEDVPVIETGKNNVSEFKMTTYANMAESIDRNGRSSKEVEPKTTPPA